MARGGMSVQGSAGASRSRRIPLSTAQVVADERLTPAPQHEEDEARAGCYAVISALLLAPPSTRLLRSLAASQDGAPGFVLSPFAQAWQRLAQAAEAIDGDIASDEFHTLFISP